MTQSSGAQANSGKVAWNAARKGRTLAQCRADMELQIRSALASQMALTDLKQVKERLHTLHERYEQQHGKLTQQNLARKLDVPYRTLQSWVNGEVETDRTNYDKFARFYRKGIGDKAITTNWILFGQQEPPAIAPAPADPEPIVLTAEDQERLKRVEEKLDELLRRTAPTAPAPPETPPGEDDDFPKDLPGGPDSPPAPPSEDEGDSEQAG